MRPFLLGFSVLAVLGTACQRTDRPSAAPSVRATYVGPPTAPLRGTHWALRRIASLPVADSTAGREPYLLISDAGTVEGLGSCNMFRGTLQPTQNDGELAFSPLRATRMSCPALSTETIYLKALQATRAYRIAGDTLWLYGNTERTGTALARLEAEPAR